MITIQKQTNQENQLITFDIPEVNNFTSNGGYIGQSKGTIEDINGFGKLMSCAEIKWGVDWKSATVTKLPDKIDDSFDLIQFILYMYNQLNPETPDIISISPSSSTINYGASSTFTATSSNKSALDNLKWSLDKSVSGVTLSATGGSTTTINNKWVDGNLTLTLSNSIHNPNLTIIKNGNSETVTCTAYVTAKTQTLKLSATLDGAQKDASSNPATVKINSSTLGNGLSISSYAWSITSGSQYISLTNTNKSTVTVKNYNSTSTDQLASIQVKVTLSNGVYNTSTHYITAKTKEETVTYYWYVGQTNPSTMSEISPIVSDTSSPGWREIGETLPTYSSSNKLHSSSNEISVGKTKATVYLALPNESLFIYDDLGNKNTAGWTLTGTRDIAGVKYYIYSSAANLKTFAFNIY